MKLLETDNFTFYYVDPDGVSLLARFAVASRPFGALASRTGRAATTGDSALQPSRKQTVFGPVGGPHRAVTSYSTASPTQKKILVNSEATLNSLN